MGRVSMPRVSTSLPPNTMHVLVRNRLHAKAPPGLEPGHDGFAIRYLSHLVTAPSNYKPHNRQIQGKPSILTGNNPQFHPNLPKNPILTRDRWTTSEDSADTDDVSLLRPKTKMVRQLVYALLVLGFAVPCFAQQFVADSDKRLSAAILKATLYAKTDDEKRFCDYVIQKRDDGTIPTRLIYGVYQKALTKDKTRRFAYFKTGLEIMCVREGIVLYPTPSRASSAPASPFTLSFLKELFQ